MTLATNLVLQVTEGLAGVDLSATLSGEVAVLTGFSEADGESFLWEDLHLINSLCLILLLYHTL